MRVTIVGVGLIGGSLALALKEKGIAQKVIGVESDPAHQQKALELGLVDEIMELDEAIKNSDLIVLATPVNAVVKLLPGVLNKVHKQIVMDVGSTKDGIMEAVKGHNKRGRFVATHPMWGTEHS